MDELRQHVRISTSCEVNVADTSRWDANEQLFPTACSWFAQTGAENSASENGDIKTHISEIANFTKVDPRFILAITMQESRGCVRVKTTIGSHDNPGLMQSNQGDNSCFGLQAGQPCSSKTISGMLMDGTSGTAAGDGLAAILQDQATQGYNGAQLYYRAARIYNSGSVATDGLLEHGGATHCYVSSIANRLTGWAANEGSYCCAWDPSGESCTATPVGGSAAATQLPASIDDGPTASHIPCAGNVAPIQTLSVQTSAVTSAVGYTSVTVLSGSIASTVLAQSTMSSAYSWQGSTTSTSTTVEAATSAAYSWEAPMSSSSLVSLPKITYLPPPSTKLGSTQISAAGPENSSYPGFTTGVSVFVTASSSLTYASVQNISTTSAGPQSAILPVTTVSVIPLPVSAYSTAASVNATAASTYTTTIQLTAPETITVHGTSTNQITVTSTIEKSVGTSELDTSPIVWPPATYGSESTATTSITLPQSTSSYDWSDLTSLGERSIVTVTITRDDCYPTASLTSTTTSTSFATTIMDTTNGPAVDQ